MLLNIRRSCVLGCGLYYLGSKSESSLLSPLAMDLDALGATATRDASPYGPRRFNARVRAQGDARLKSHYARMKVVDTFAEPPFPRES